MKSAGVQAIVISPEEAAQAERLRYVLSHGSKKTASAVRGQHPFDRPARPKKSPAPLFHAVSKRVRLELWAAYAWFVCEFRQASEKLRSGDRMARFPAGSFPPALPFVAG
jgi:hypothetical protein